MSVENRVISSVGHKLDCRPHAFGRLRDSSDVINQPDALRYRMQEEGYLYLPALLNPLEVEQARREIATRLAAQGYLEATYPVMDCVVKPGVKMNFRPDLALQNLALKKLLYSDQLMEFFQVFLGGEVRPFDYTWLRAVAPGLGTYPHCDIVYMGRGTAELYTAWVPLGDISLEMGGLMILEKSHRLESIRNSYGRKDVDSYCRNRKTAQLYASGQREWDGALSKNPVSLRQRYGGRWLTNEFKAGDVLIFSVFTVHASLDNQSRQIRLSSDSRYQLSSDPVDERWIGENPIGHSIAAKRGRVC